MNQKRRKKPSLLVNLILGLGALSILGLLVGVPLLLLRSNPADSEDQPVAGLVVDNQSAEAPIALIEEKEVAAAGVNLVEEPKMESVVVGTPVNGSSMDGKSGGGGVSAQNNESPKIDFVTETKSNELKGNASFGQPDSAGMSRENTTDAKSGIVVPNGEPIQVVTNGGSPTGGMTAASNPPAMGGSLGTLPGESKPDGSSPDMSPVKTSPTESQATLVQNVDELEQFKEDVYARIEAARNEDYPLEMKEAARETLRRVKGLFKLGTVVFSKPGSKELDPAMETELMVKLQQPDIVKWADQTEARIISLGFADPTGTPAANAALSRDRAIAVNEFIKTELPSIRTYGFGIGATTVVDTKRKENNRAVEIWLAVGQAAGAN
jgi:outer membrane protein OmpA-like peptidoglycan-associated protein